MYLEFPRQVSCDETCSDGREQRSSYKMTVSSSIRKFRNDEEAAFSLNTDLLSESNLSANKQERESISFYSSKTAKSFTGEDSLQEVCNSCLPVHDGPSNILGQAGQ